MKTTHALVGGLAGACAVTVIHQIVKKYDKKAPRMDLLGMESLTKILDKFNVEKPDEATLYKLTMAGDILSNTIYYAAAGIGAEKTLLKGAILGSLAGVGAVALPEPMGLDPKHSNRTNETKILSVAYYLVGGLLSSAVMQLLGGRKSKGIKVHIDHLKSNIL